MITILIAGYEVNFNMVIKYELYDRAFGDLTIIPFPCLIQQLCDEFGVPKISNCNRILEEVNISWTSVTKDPANLILD